MPHTAARHIAEEALQIGDIRADRLFGTVLLIAQKTLETVQDGAEHLAGNAQRRFRQSRALYLLRRKRAGVGHRQSRGGSLVPVFLPVLTPVGCLVFSSVFGLAGGGHASLLSGFGLSTFSSRVY